MVATARPTVPVAHSPRRLRTARVGLVAERLWQRGKWTELPLSRRTVQRSGSEANPSFIEGSKRLQLQHQHQHKLTN